jgi:hypothetical protein
MWPGEIFFVNDNSFTSICSKGNEKKRKHTPLDLPDGSGLGDHIQLLQIYEHWDRNNCDIGWCKDHDLQVLFYVSESVLYLEISCKMCHIIC